MDVQDLHEELELSLSRNVGGASEGYQNSLAAALAALGEEDLRASGGWFDWGTHPDADGEVPVGVHLRLLSDLGVITVDYEFSFDGSPDARLLPWTRVQAIRVIARRSREQVNVANAWLETELGRIEFAGVQRFGALDQLVDVIRTRLK